MKKRQWVKWGCVRKDDGYLWNVVSNTRYEADSQLVDGEETLEKLIITIAPKKRRKAK